MKKKKKLSNIIYTQRDMVTLDTILWFLLATISAKLFLFITKTSSSIKLPPGPTPFPVIGNLAKLGNKPHKSLAELAKTYGPIMTLKLGSLTTIVISSATLAEQVLKKQDASFANRFVPDALQAHSHDQVSVVWLSPSPKWRSLRKICVSNIFSIQKLEANQHIRRRKTEDLLEDVRKSCKNGDAVDIGQAAFKTTLNLISNTMFSQDLVGTNSDEARELKEIVSCIMEEAGKPNLADYFPMLKKFDPQHIRHRMTNLFGKMFEIFDSMIDQRLKSRKEDGFVTSNDMLDTLISITEDSKEEIDRIDVENLLLDLFAAGTDTSSSTLEWAMAEVLRKPNILSKAKAELEKIIGKGNTIEESDITRLPYLQAIIKETFRLHPAVPFLLPRSVKSDTELCGYTVPKGVQLLVNVWAIGRDSSTWENPAEFMPERFLGLDMDVRGNDFELIPFGAGRRICPGLPLAMRMIHVMLGSLLHSFDWKLEDGVQPDNVDMDDRFGITVQKAKPLFAVPIQMK